MSAHFKYLFDNEDIYLLDGETHTAPAATSQEVVEAPEAKIEVPAVEEKKVEEVQKSEPVVKEQAAPSPSPAEEPKLEKAAPAKKLVLADREVTAAEKAFLDKVLSAIQLKPDDYEIRTTTNVNGEREYMFFFSGAHSDCQKSENGKAVLAPDLATIANEKAHKQSLWALMQELFL